MNCPKCGEYLGEKCPDCSRDWGHGSCGTCHSYGWLKDGRPYPPPEQMRLPSVAGLSHTKVECLERQLATVTAKCELLEAQLANQGFLVDLHNKKDDEQ